MRMEEINEFIEAQLQAWPMAHANYIALGATERRRFRLGDFEGAVQFNPARIRSTGADVSKEAVRQRACFLCKENRPKEQTTMLEMEGYEMILNPYPIFPVHFTIPLLKHEPQDEFPLEMAAFAEKFPQLAIFFNGAKAGASAPDHAHMQAVLKTELPIVALTERLHPATEGGIKSSDEFGADLPFRYWSAVISPDLDGMKALAELPTLVPDRELVNAYFWISDGGLLRAVVIPRRAHRPACYFDQDEEKRRMVSPGAVDMAGIIVVPRREDFERLTDEEIARIYRECGMQ